MLPSTTNEKRKEECVEKEILISTLRHQKNLMADMLLALEAQEIYQDDDCDYESLIRDMEKSLKKLRRWIF